MTAAVTTPTGTDRGRVGLGDLLWLSWRTHRTGIAVLAVLVAGYCGWMVWNLQRIGLAQPAKLGPSECAGGLEGGCRAYTGAFFGAGTGPYGTGFLQVDLVPVFAALVAVFLATPLLPREYERRTHLLVWGQDVSPRRWLAAHALLLGGAAVLLSVALGALSGDVLARIGATYQGAVNEYQAFSFEATWYGQAGYAVLAFAVGLACGAVLRRTVPAMTSALVLFAVLRLLIGRFRFDYLPAVRVTAPFTGMFRTPSGTYLDLGSGTLAADGHQVTRLPPACVNTGNLPFPDWADCLRHHGIAQQFNDFQPAGRITDFRLIELGVCLVLAVAFAVVARQRTRRPE